MVILLESKRRESIKEWLNVLGPILVGILTGLCFVIAAYITKQPAVIYEIQQTPFFEKTNTIELFPLKANNEWHYKGKVVIPDIDQEGQTFEKEVELTAQVVEEISDNDLTLFIMNGHWRNLCEYWPKIKKADKEPIVIPTEEYGYLVVSNKIYYIPPDRLEDAVEFMRNNDKYIAPIEQNNLEFEFPLFKGQRYGHTPDISRKDFNFCWYVNDEVYDHIPNGNTVLTMPRYSIVYSTIIEYVAISFEAYLGITAFDYHDQAANVNFQLSLDSYELK